jgi:L-lactate dehydrogenase complex protein LldF
MSATTEQFHHDADFATADEPRRTFVRRALSGYEVKRDETKATFTDWQAARNAAAAVKYEGVNHLADYLEEFERNFTARGGKVFWASNSDQAREYILNLAREKGVKSIIKSKAMTSEEIHLNPALIAAGYEVVESDLGEFIQQLMNEPPYHFRLPVHAPAAG